MNKQREIKFRAFRKKYGMTEPFTLGDLQDKCEFNFKSSGYLSWNEFGLEHPDTKLMQYIGIKDKDGIEIYEGYKVIISPGYGGDYFYKETESVVIWEECEFCLDPFVWQDFCWDELKVIGNIYEKE